MPILRPAENLDEALETLQLSPLEAKDTFYSDLSEARGSNFLGRLRLRLRDAAKLNTDPCHAAFIGHRGSGKTTELLRLEESLSDVFYSAHIDLDQTLHLEADYPDIMLWMVESIVKSFDRDKIPLPIEEAEKVAGWFASVTKVHEDTTKATIETGGEVETGIKWNIFGPVVKLIARVKSQFVGSTERRKEMRSELKNRATELIQLVNTFLIKARAALVAADKPGRLLIVQDNLDRLSREAALALFRDNAGILTQIDADCIWTAPVGTQLSPFDIGKFFTTFFMPTISVRDRDGAEQPKAVAGLTRLLEKRMKISLTFADPAIAHRLVVASGGSIRDLLRIAEAARLNAQVENHTVIESSDVDAAILERRLALQRILIPGNIYFPILADIAATKQWSAEAIDGITPETVQSRLAFFHQLILEGAIFEYNGTETWYSIHPALDGLRQLTEATAQRAAAAGKPAAASKKPAKTRARKSASP